MAKPDNGKPWCFHDFFNLLCVKNGKSPSQANETELLHQNNDEEEAKPGLVARLMGLDSVPNSNFSSNGRRTITDSVPRSRSVNFLDYMLKIDTNQHNLHGSKTSTSFREVPSLFDHKNHHEHVLHYLDSSNEDQELRQRKKQGSKNKESVKERNHGKSKKISKLKNEPRVVPMPIKHSSKVGKHNESDEVSASASNCSKKKKKKVSSKPKHSNNIRKLQSAKKIESEYSSASENFIPVSVLSDNEYPFLYGPDFLDYTSPLMLQTNCESSESKQLF